MIEHPISQIPPDYLDGRSVWGRDIHSTGKFHKIAMYYDATHSRWYDSRGDYFVKPTHFILED